MRAVAVEADVVVVQSSIWRTTSTAVRGGPDEAFVIDSPVLPDELEAWPGVLGQAGFRVVGLIATHADWDHLLGPLAFPEAPLGVGDASARRLAKEPGAAQRELRSFDEEHYVTRPRPLSLGGVQELPVPGRVDVGEHELEVHPAEGHTADGIAVVAPWASVLVCGDYLSPVEIPMLSPGGSLDAYRATLERLVVLAARSATVVPGHGGPIGRDQALALAEEDRSYLDALERDGAGAALPESRRSPSQRAIHADNARRVEGAA